MTIYDELDDFLFFLARGAVLGAEERQEEVSTGLKDAFLLASYFLEVRYSPYLLREFISLHLNTALKQCEEDIEFVVASRIMEEIKNLPEPDRSLTLRDIQKDNAPAMSVLRRVCRNLEQERLRCDNEG